jgi:hypothetical protein
MPWYEWRNARDRLVLFGRAIQGISPYRVLIEPDPGKCPTGYCNFTRREIAANPSLFTARPREQYDLTKAVLVHEAGHRRFTTPGELPAVVHTVANILEDERIERLMAQEFAGLRPLVRLLAECFHRNSPEIDATSESPGEVVAYFLQLRWATRLGIPVKGCLSSANEGLWRKVEPLVHEAWSAPTSDVVERNARRIVRILGLKQPQIPAWVAEVLEKLGETRGERKSNDSAEEGRGNDCPYSEAELESSTQEPFDGEVPPNDKRLGNGQAAIEPHPYIWLEEKVRPLAEKLVEELRWEEAASRPEPAERGGRFSVREYLRNESQPFLVQEDSPKEPPTLALKVIVDHSTSLNVRTANGTRIESIAESVMMLHLVCLALGIRHEVIVTPQGFSLGDGADGERGKALIAGLIPARCGYEDMGEAIRRHAVPMAGDPEDLKVVLCLTDGACNDAPLGKTVCTSLRGRVEVIGLLLDPDESTKGYVEDMFGKDRLICCHSEALPGKLAQMLRTVRGI